jgi:hypothetical protein
MCANPAGGFNPLRVSPTPPVSPDTSEKLLIRPSLSDAIKAQSMQPPLGARFKTEDLTTEEQEFIAKFETPDVKLRVELEKALGPNFAKIAHQLEQDGVVILSEYFSGDQLEKLQDFFEHQIEQKPIRPFLEQASFNGGVDAKTALTESEAMSEALADPFFILLSSHHLGHPAVMANWRGYRLEPREPLLYRAWSWHQDQKRSEIKVMILLSDVNPEGQAMQVIKGSHHKWWKMESQRDTKYTLDEVLAFGNDPGKQQVTKCYGKAGTIIIFNTNVAHSGYRNLSERRDVITMNYLANIEGMPVFPSPSLHPKVAAKYQEGFMAYAMRAQAGSVEELSEQMQQDLSGGKDLGVKARVEALSQVTQDFPPDHAPIPRFSDAREHYRGDDFTSLKTFLHQHALDDFGPDLDLVVRLGDKDVKRDIVLARLRDARPDHPINEKLKDFSELTLEDINSERSLSLEDLKSDASNLSMHMVTCKKMLEEKLASLDPQGQIECKQKIQSLDESIEFCNDLAEAFTRTDSLERLRTNLIFLRALYLQHGLVTQEPQFFNKERDLMKLQAYVIYNEDSHR